MKVYELEQGPDGVYVPKRIREEEPINEIKRIRKKKRAPVQNNSSEDSFQKIGDFLNGLSIITREVKKIMK